MIISPSRSKLLVRAGATALSAAVILALVAASATASGADPAASTASTVTAATASADFGSIVQYSDAYTIGMVSSGYGANPLSSATQSSAEQQLDARYIRIPVGIRNGVVNSSASGAGNLDVTALAAKYRSWGYHILAVIGGRTNDFDVRAGDATRIMQALGFGGVDYTGPNEPNNMGKTIADVLNVDAMIEAEGKALNPNFKLWGPVWSYPNRTELKSFAQGMGGNLAGVDYHHYGMGSTSISTANLMNATPTWGQEVANERADLSSLGNTPNVNVDEVNLSWRYNDGTSVANGGDGNGGDNRFFTAVNSVFIASTCGHILIAGGRCLPYASQNGPLGMTVEAGQLNPDNRAASTPMPGYWGIAAFTGAHLWPHMKDTFYATATSDANIEAYAVNNEAGGDNVVLINKSGSNSTALSLTLKSIAAGTVTTYQSNPSAPYAAPAKIATGSYGGSTNVSLPAMSVTVLTLHPGTSTPPPPATKALYRIAAGGNTVTGFTAPATMVTGGTAAGNAGTTTPPPGIPAQLFQGERWGSQTYTLPVTGAIQVSLRLLFAERYAPSQKVGGREFNVTVNGTTVATNYDIWVHQGQQVTGYAQITATVTPINGRVTISLTNGAVGSPTINGVLLDTTS